MTMKLLKTFALTGLVAAGAVAALAGSASACDGGPYYGYAKPYYRPVYRPYGFGGVRRVVAVPVRGGFSAQPINLGQGPDGPGGPGVVPPGGPGGIASAPNGPGGPVPGGPGPGAPNPGGPGVNAPGGVAPGGVAPGGVAPGGPAAVGQGQVPPGGAARAEIARPIGQPQIDPSVGGAGAPPVQVARPGSGSVLTGRVSEKPNVPADDLDLPQAQRRGR
jgi:hypothetical protein